MVYGSMRIQTEFTKIKTVLIGESYDWRYRDDFNSDLGLPVTDESKKR
jgi:hypothetical protein